MAAETMPLIILQNLPDAWRLARFFGAIFAPMLVLARACGHENLSDFNPDDLSSWKLEMAHLSGVAFARDANHLRR
jgi:hypothetical protein